MVDDTWKMKNEYLITGFPEQDGSVKTPLVFQLLDGEFSSDQLMPYLSVALALQKLW